VVETYQAALTFCDCVDPATDHEARFSLQHAVAAAWLCGAPGIQHFGAEWRDHVQLKALRKQIVLRESADINARFPDQYGACVTVEYQDGSSGRFQVDSALGDPENPLDPQQRADKFQRLATHAGIGEDSADALRNTVLSLASADTLDGLSAALSTVNTELKSNTS